MKNFLLILISFFTLYSCNDISVEIEDETQKNTAKEIITSDFLFNSVFTIAIQTIHEIELKENLKYGQLLLFSDTCADVSYFLSKDSSYVENITINYGKFSCSPFGQRKIGKIHIFLTGLISEEGTTVRVDLQDFYFEHHKVEGTESFVNTSFPGFSWCFEQIVEHGKISLPGGAYILYESQKEVNINFSSNAYVQTSKSCGFNSSGIKFNTETVTPLEKSFSCEFVQKGSIIIELADYSDMIVDYGDGTCDNLYNITSEFNEYQSIGCILE